MPSFTVPCPSCEAKVLIKNPDLVGTKVECPKCKYRFKLEAPADAPAADAKASKDKTDPKAPKADAKAADAKAGGKKDEKKKDKKEKKAAAAGGKKNKKMLGIVAGVVGVIVLAVGGFVVFGGGDDTKPSTASSTTPRPSIPSTSPGSPDTGNPDTSDDGKDKKKDEPKKPVTVVAKSDKDPTNLLPNDSVAVYRFDIDRLRTETPLGGLLLDKAMTDLFQSSMGERFDPLNVERYIHCVVGEKERAPFGLIWLREPTAESDIKIAGAGAGKPVKGKTLYPVKGNAFLTAIGGAMSARSLFADVYEQPPAGKDIKAADKPLGACVYDSQVILVGDYKTLEKFLSGLKDGYPEFQTVLKKEEPPPESPMSPMGMGPMAPPAGGPPPPTGTTPPSGGPPPTTGSAQPKGGPPPTGTPPPMTPPGTGPMMTPPGAKGPNPSQANRDYTSNPTYLSVTGDLKKLMNAIDDDPTGRPMVALVEKFDNAVYSRKGVKKAFEPLVKVIDPILNRTRYLGVSLRSLSPASISGSVRIVGKTADDARHIALEELTPALTDAVPVLSLVLFTNPLTVEFWNWADPNRPPPGAGSPTGPFGLPFPMSPGGPPPAGGSSGYPMAGFPMASGPPPVPMGSSGGPPPMTMSPGYPPPMGSGMGPLPFGLQGDGQWQMQTQPTGGLVSRVEMRLTDQTVTVSAEIHLTDEAYGLRVVPRVLGLANEVKGKAMVFAGSRSWFGLGQAVAKYVEQNKKFPSGTVSRTTDPSRLGLPYPPMQRLSFFAEFLPLLGRDAISSELNRGKGWYDPENAAATDSWVPEFLVTSYPQSAWRATSPLVPERVFGGTNFVAVAGVGVDAARFDPKAKPKLVGLSGYDWGSKVEEVTDGLANTIYLLQVPPGYARPWAAGGGATMTGLNPADPMADFKHKRPDGKEGTYAIMGDGTVRWIPADIKPSDLLALATRAGGEKLSADLDAIAPKVDQTGKDVELKATKSALSVPTPAEKKAVEAKPADAKPADKGAKPAQAPPPKEKD
jgi:hypothetical protein